MSNLRRTVFFDQHLALGAKMVEFGGWEMPIMYPEGIIREHLETRRGAGLFDVSHMGRFAIRGKEASPFLQHVLISNAAALDIETIGAQYTLIPTETGGAVDDAYLYRFQTDEYLLAVNAANQDKDQRHLRGFSAAYPEIQILDRTREIAMLSLQGPASQSILQKIMPGKNLPEPRRNSVCTVSISGIQVLIARTGYTGEPLCFELFVDRNHAPPLWDLLLAEGA